MSRSIQLPCSWTDHYKSDGDETVGNFQLTQMFVFRSLLVQEFFFWWNSLHDFFFFSDKYFFFWTVKSWFTVYVFVLNKLLYIHNRSKDTGHLLLQNPFENVRTVREEEATWSGRLPAFFQSLPSGIPLLQPIIMMPFIHQNSPSVVPYLFRKSETKSFNDSKRGGRREINHRWVVCKGRQYNTNS